MTLNTAHQASPPFGLLIGATLLGFVLVVAGLAMAYLAIATPVVAELVPGANAGGSMGIGFGRTSPWHAEAGRGARTRTWNQRDISPPL